MRALFLSCAVVLSACSGQSADVNTGEVSAPASELAPELVPAIITLQNAYVVPPFPGRDIAAGFFDITNAGGAAKLIAASSPAARAIEIHTHINDDGVMRMRPIAAVELGQDKTVQFKQGGYHLMLFGADISAATNTVDVTLEFENAPSQTLSMPVRQHGETDAAGSGHGSGTHGSGTDDSGKHGSDNHGSGTDGSDNHGSGK